MKQTNSAIKFLMAQYRAIFNNAYFKGLATAAVATVALAAGQAQAAATLTGELVADAAQAQDIVSTGESDSLEVQSGKKFAKTITVQKGANLTLSGSVSAAGNVTVNGGKLTVGPTSGQNDGMLLLGSNNDSANHVYQYDLIINEGSTLDHKQGNIGVANFDIKGSTITLSSGGAGGTNLTAYGVGAIQEVAAPKNLSYTAKGNLTDVKATVNGATNITAIGTLNISGTALDKSTLTLVGDVDATQNHTNLAYVGGSKHLNINKTTITASGDSGSAIVSTDLNIKDSKLDVKTTGSLTIGGLYDRDKAAGESATLTDYDQATNTIAGTTLSVAASANLNFGAEGTNTALVLSGNTIENKGTVNFYTPEMSMSSADLKAFIGGTVDFKTAKSELTLTDTAAVDLSSASGAMGLLQDANGQLKAGVTITNDLTLNADKLVLGTAFDAANLSLKAGSLTVGKDFTQKQQNINVSSALTGEGKYTIDTTAAKAALNLEKAGTVTGIKDFEVKAASNSGNMVVTGDWNLGGANVTASGAAAQVDFKDQGTAGVTNVGVLTADSGKILLTNTSVTAKGFDIKASSELSLTNSTLTTNDVVKSAEANLVKLADNSTLKVAYDKVVDTAKDEAKQDALKAVSGDGTSTIVLTGRESGVIAKAKLDALKTAFLGAGQGLFKVEGATLSAEDSGISGSTVSYDKAQANAGYADIYENVTVTGVTSAAITTSNDWGAAQLDNNVDNLTIGAGTVTLNGVQGSDNLVSKSDKTTAAGVALENGSTLSVQGKGGTIDSITATADQGKVLVGAALKVNKDVGADTAKVNELTVQANGSVAATNAFVNTLNVNQGATLTLAGNADTDGKLTLAKASTVDGTVIAKAVSAAENLNVNGKVKADSLAFSATGKTVFVGQDGENSASGILDLATLDLNGGSLIIDPEWKDNASLGFVGGDAKTDIVTTGGKVGVGKNAAFVAGMRDGDPAAAAILARYTNAKGSLDKNGNNALDADEVGALFIANETYKVESNLGVIVDPNKKSTDFAAAFQNNQFDLGAGAALVVTDELTESIVNTSGSVINFATKGTLTLAQGSKVIIDGAITAKDKLNLVNTGNTVTNNGKDNILIGNGFFTGNLDAATGQISFAIDKDKVYAGLYNQSAPVKDLTFAALEGKYGSLSTINDNVKYIIDMSDVDGGKAVEGTANLALYGGAVQGTALAQQAANDAVVDRMNRSNPNGSLVFANNAQGGGLWLSPVYKNHESDSFDADGVDYGVDGDLTGLVLGADSTSESGVRVGGYFNFGSADFDGQGVGDQVSNEADYFGFGLYAGMTAGQFSLLADAGFTQVSNDIEQSVNYKDYSKVKADVDSTAVTLGLRGEYKLNVATMDVTPHLGVRYTRLAIDSYDAKMNGYVLASSDFDTMQMFSIPFGVTVSKDIAAGAWTIKPVFDLTLTANAGDTDAKLNTIFPGSDAISITSEAFDSFTYGAIFGLDAKYGENFSIGLNTNYTGSSNADEFGVMGNARYMF